MKIALWMLVGGAVFCSGVAVSLSRAPVVSPEWSAQAATVHAPVAPAPKK